MERNLYLDEKFVNEPIAERNTFLFRFHVISLTIIWVGMANVGLICRLFRHSLLSYYIHAISMWIVAIFTFVGSFMEIAAQAASTENSLHEIAGLIVLGLTLIICLMGVWLRHSQESHKIAGQVVRYSRIAHLIGGMLLYIGAQIALLSAWWKHEKTIFSIIVIIEIVFFTIWCLCRIFPPKISSMINE